MQNRPISIAFGTLNKNGRIRHFELFATFRTEITVSCFPTTEFIKLIVADDLSLTLATGARKILLTYRTNGSFHVFSKKTFYLYM